MAKQHYRVSVVKDDGKEFKPVNEIYWQPEKYYQELENFEKTFLGGYVRVDSANIGTSDNPCTRHIYKGTVDRYLIYINGPLNVV